MLIVGFGSKARHGKDTAGEAVVAYYERQRERAIKHYGQSVFNIGQKPAKLYKFADALYRECREQHGMTEKDAPLLQRVGMVRRNENKDYWIDQVAADIDRDKPEIAVITDVRFPNEADFIYNRGGILVNVSRLDATGEPYVATDRPADHPSETALDEYAWSYFIKAYTGESALVEQLAVCIVEFERARRP